MDVVSGTILSLEANLATVSVASLPACARCAAGKGCGAGLFQASTEPRQIQVQIPDDMGVHVGAEVDLTIGDRRLLQAAFLAYGLPLTVMILFVIVYQLFSAQTNDGLAVVTAIVGLLVGALAGRALLQRESVCELFKPAVCSPRHV